MPAMGGKADTALVSHLGGNQTLAQLGSERVPRPID